MSPCHNLEPSLVARDSSRLLSVKPNEWMHLSPFYTRMHGEWLRYAKSTSQFHWRFLLVRDVRGFQVNPLCRHDITSPFPPSGNGGYVRNLDVILPILIKSACWDLQRPWRRALRWCLWTLDTGGRQMLTQHSLTYLHWSTYFISQLCDGLQGSHTPTHTDTDTQSSGLEVSLYLGSLSHWFSRNDRNVLYSKQQHKQSAEQRGFLKAAGTEHAHAC